MSVISSSALFMFLFFFYCAGSHRDLHSFPTRRSSDLIRVEAVRVVGGTKASVVDNSLRPRLIVVAHRTRYRIHSLDVQDRKSTRLNSSHGYISYAVFCLKKKNTHKDTLPLLSNTLYPS